MVSGVQTLITSETRLIEMTIQSAPCEHIQESGELKSVARDVSIARSLKAKGWSVACTSEIEMMMHRLAFVVDERGKEKARKMQMDEKELNKVRSRRRISFSNSNQCLCASSLCLTLRVTSYAVGFSLTSSIF